MRSPGLNIRQTSWAFAVATATPKVNPKSSERKPLSRRGVANTFILAALVCVAALIYLSSLSKESIAATNSSSDPMPVAGETWYVQGAPIGCRDNADLQRLIDLSQQGDPAFRALYVQKSLAGQCQTLLDETPVVIENDNILGHPCVKLSGDSTCLFMISSRLFTRSKRS
jgi:hypothetical protein